MKSLLFTLTISLLSLSACGESSARLPATGDKRGAEDVMFSQNDQVNLADARPFAEHPNAHWDNEPVYLIMSGYGSCVKSETDSRAGPHGSNLHKSFFEQLGNRLGPNGGRISHWVMACQPYDDHRSLFVSSDNPSVIQSGMQSDVQDAAARLSRSHESPVIIMGHSYGGAYAMQAAMHMAQDIPVRYLLSLDPISPVHCRPQHLATLLYGRITHLMGLNDANREPGCIVSPLEFKPEHYEFISTRVQFWMHYYQQDLFEFLRATPIEQACNREIKHDTIKGSLNGHVEMQFYPKFWNDIEELVSNRVPGQCVQRSI